MFYLKVLGPQPSKGYHIYQMTDQGMLLNHVFSLNDLEKVVLNYKFFSSMLSYKFSHHFHQQSKVHACDYKLLIQPDFLLGLPGLADYFQPPIPHQCDYVYFPQGYSNLR